MTSKHPTQCYVDESVHRESGFIVSAFVFSAGRTDLHVGRALSEAGLRPGVDEFKSGSRMAANSKMQRARVALLTVANTKTKIGIFVGMYERGTLGKHSLQALQSIIVRNAIRPSAVDLYFDEGIFPSSGEARRLHALFHSLRAARLHPIENSRIRLGIQIADAVAGSFGQILKETLSGKVKQIDIGGPDTGYEVGTMAPLGWDLLMSLRYALLTRPVVYGGRKYPIATDPVVLDPMNDDPAVLGQHPTLLGWGVQIAPNASDELRHAVEQRLGRIWLGCIH